jgi:hypothetical protein
MPDNQVAYLTKELKRVAAWGLTDGCISRSPILTQSSGIELDAPLDVKRDAITIYITRQIKSLSEPQVFAGRTYGACTMQTQYGILLKLTDKSDAVARRQKVIRNLGLETDPMRIYQRAQLWRRPNSEERWLVRILAEWILRDNEDSQTA